MHEKHLVGIYDTENEVIRAVENLKREGYAAQEISVIGKNKEQMNEINEATSTNTEDGFVAGAATGGALGGLAGLLAGLGALVIPGIGPFIAVGPLAATLTGAAVGAGAGGLAGALIGMGLPEEEANRYEGLVNEGKFIVLVERRENRVGEHLFTNRVNQSSPDPTTPPDNPPVIDTPITDIDSNRNF